MSVTCIFLIISILQNLIIKTRLSICYFWLVPVCFFVPVPVYITLQYYWTEGILPTGNNKIFYYKILYNTGNWIYLISGYIHMEVLLVSYGIVSGSNRIYFIVFCVVPTSETFGIGSHVSFKIGRRIVVRLLLSLRVNWSTFVRLYHYMVP